jgi:phospholipase C
MSAAPATITAGGLTTLTWTTQNATSVAISPDPNPSDDTALPLSGSVPVTPSATTVYKLTATGPGGQGTAQATVTVNQPPPVLTATVTPAAQLVAGQSATISWSAQNVTSISIDQGIGAVVVPTGSVNVTPAATTVYTLTGTGPGGTITAQATVNVAPLGQLAVNIIATPSATSPAQPVTLSWASQNATTVSIDQGVGTEPLTGTATVTPTVSTTYTATATDAAGHTVTSTASVKVDQSGVFQTKIKHIIILVQENRSFDNYFGLLGQYKASHGFANDVNGLDTTVKVKDKAGNLVSPFHYRTICTENLSPQWNESHIIYDGGKMDGWMLPTLPSTIDPNGHRAMGYYDQSDMPYYYELATQFAVGDAVFSPVLTNTNPNRMYLFTGTSFGKIIPDPTSSAGQYQQKTIFDLLTEHNVPWRYYYQDNGLFLFQFGTWTNNNGAAQANAFNIANYYTILADPNADNLLPPVVFIERATPTGLDEHPDKNLQAGIANTKKIIDALMASPAWQSSIFILTYDEGGALYDHVPPIPLPAPDAIPPALQPNDRPGDFTLSGFRVPFVVVSPWVRAHYVSHVQRDYTAMLKMVEKRFNLPALTLRDAAADDLLDFFDFTTPSWPTPPPLPDQPTSGVCDQNLETGP